MNPSNKKKQEESKTTITAFLPYINKVTDHIGNVLKTCSIKTVYLPTKKIRDFLKPVKDHIHIHKKAGVYRIPCSCGQVYIGTTKRSVATRLKEHERHSRLKQVDKSAVAEHSMLQDHKIQYENTDVLSTTVHYHTRLQREAIEIFKHHNNFNRKEETRKINKVWIPILKKTKTKHLQHDKLREETSNQTPDLKADQSTQRHALRSHGLCREHVMQEL